MCARVRVCARVYMCVAELIEKGPFSSRRPMGAGLGRLLIGFYSKRVDFRVGGRRGPGSGGRVEGLGRLWGAQGGFGGLVHPVFDVWPLLHFWQMFEKRTARRRELHQG